jgi:hypothetical protein
VPRKQAQLDCVVLDVVSTAILGGAAAGDAFLSSEGTESAAKIMLAGSSVLLIIMIF